MSSQWQNSLKKANCGLKGCSDHSEIVLNRFPDQNFLKYGVFDVKKVKKICKNGIYKNIQRRCYQGFKVKFANLTRHNWSNRPETSSNRFLDQNYINYTLWQLYPNYRAQQLKQKNWNIAVAIMAESLLKTTECNLLTHY